MVASYLLPPLPSRPPKVVGIPRNQVKRYTYLRQYHSAPPIVPTPRKEKKKKRKPTFGYGLLPPVVVDSRLLEFSRTQTRLFLSLLDSQKGKGALNPDFADDKSDVSSRSGSIKGKSLKRKKDKATSPLPVDYISEQDKEYVGNVPVASLRGDGSSVPQLPHIAGAVPLTPIGEASREGTRMTIPVSLPPISKEHGIDEFSDESGVGVKTDRTGQTDRRHFEDSERRRRQRKTHMEETGNQTGPSLSGGYHLHSSTESLGGPASSHSLPNAKPLRTHWKGSTQSLKSDRSKKGSGSLPEDGSVKGSIVIGPDGEPISVGGHIDAHVRPDLLHHIENVGEANRHFGRDLISDYESDDEPDAWKRRRRVQREDMRNYANKRGSGQSMQSGQISEKDIIDVLENTARHVAASTLSRSDSGQDLERDARQAAELWLEKNAPRIISRSQSVQDVQGDRVALKSAAGNGRKSAGPTAGEYRDLIKEKLQTALSNTDGESIPVIPDDAELSPELIEALKNNSLSPEDLEVVKDEETGKNIVRSRSQMSAAMGGVKEGHIYVPVAKKEDEQDDHKSQRSGQRSEDGEVEEPEDEFKKALAEVEKANEDRKSGVSRKSDDKKSVASSEDKKSKVSIKTEKSDAKKTPVKKEEFVVGKVSTKGELEKLFGEYGLPPPKPSQGKKKGKAKDGKGKKPPKKPTKATKGKGKPKEEEPKQAQTAEPEPEPAPEKEPTPPPVLPPVEDKAASDNESDKESIAETHKTEESSDFEFIRDTPSPSPPPPPKPPSTIPSVDDEPTDDEEKQEGEDDEAARLRMISNREARAAKRAAQAAKRKEDVERKRREKEEQARRERDEQERAEQLKREMEAERKRTLEAKRQKKLEEEAEREREAQLEEEKIARQKAEAEREKRRKEEYQRKLDEMKRKQAEEEQKRYEEQMQRLREEEEKRKAEEILMAQMAEEERKEYERKKKEEEEARKKKEEEERRRREEEAQRAMEEARKLAEEMARRQAELEARLKFNRELQVEARGLDHSHNITEAFVFSYFELLNWFGLDIPEFEMMKISQY